MLFHFTDVDSPPAGWAGLVFFGTHQGRHGVDLFFVLSGFLVGGLLLKEWKDTGGVDARRFLLRRIFNIWPPLYVLLLFHTVVRRHPLHEFLWQNLLHIQNFFGTTLPQTRSLAIEEHFYLLLTVGVALLAARTTFAGSAARAVFTVCLCGCLISLLARCVTVWFYPDTINPYWTQNRLDAPFLGVALAALFHLRPAVYRRVAARRSPLLLACFGGLALLFWKPWESDLMMSVGLTVFALACCAFLVLMLEHSGRMTHWLPYRLVARIGVYAYGIFLWHSAVRQPVLSMFRWVPESWRWMVTLPIQLALACVVGFAATRVVEWPMLRWRESKPYLADHSRLLPETELGDEPGADDQAGDLEAIVSPG